MMVPVWVREAFLVGGIVSLGLCCEHVLIRLSEKWVARRHTRKLRADRKSWAYPYPATVTVTRYDLPEGSTLIETSDGDYVAWDDVKGKL